MARPAVPGRRDERFKADLTIRFHQADGTLLNVSASGVYFLTDAPLQRGQVLTFTMEFTGTQCAHTGEARVVRVVPEGARKGVGAVFENIEFEHLSPP